MRSLVAIGLLAACTEPVVEMELVLPQNAENYATSCINAIEVRATGADIALDVDDYEYGCLDIVGGGASYAAIRDEIRGKFELDIPDTGLSGIEVYGWSGPSACDQEGDPLYEFGATPNLLFRGRGNYIGQDKIEIPIAPNLGCADTQIKVRMFDMLALVGGATCDVAGMSPAAGGASIGTLGPRLIGRGVEMYGMYEGAFAQGNLATFTGSMQTAGTACVAVDGGFDMVSGTTGCYNGGASVCAAPGEVEHPVMSFITMYNGASYSDDLLAKFPGVTLGSVWNNATPRATLAGAKVTLLDATHGKVVYVDPPDANGVMATRANQDATGPSGLFMVYADTIVKARIEGNGAMREVQFASLDDRTAGAMIVMGP